MKSSILALSLLTLGSVNAETLYDSLKSNSNVTVDFTVEASNWTKGVANSGQFKDTALERLRPFAAAADITPRSYIFLGVDYANMNAVATEWEFRIITKIQTETVKDELTCNKKFNVGFSDSMWSWGRATFAINKVVSECISELNTYLQNKTM